jgi:hypothetical protein
LEAEKQKIELKDNETIQENNDIHGVHIPLGIRVVNITSTFNEEQQEWLQTAMVLSKSRCFKRSLKLFTLT